MTVRTCGAANTHKIDDCVLINHPKMKLKLHTACNKDSLCRVNLCHNDSLFVASRVYGSNWRPDRNVLPEAIAGIVRDFLIFKNDRGFYYIQSSEIEPWIKRFAKE